MAKEVNKKEIIIKSKHLDNQFLDVLCLGLFGGLHRLDVSGQTTYQLKVLHSQSHARRIPSPEWCKD
jgi:hypothetical protein